jgi:hypothetical protein
MPAEDAKDPKTIETVTVTSLAELRAALQAGGMVVASDIPWQRKRGRWRQHFRSATVRIPAPAPQPEER